MAAYLTRMTRIAIQLHPASPETFGYTLLYRRHLCWTQCHWGSLFLVCFDLPLPFGVLLVL